jgi:hypothetical protein
MSSAVGIPVGDARASDAVLDVSPLANPRAYRVFGGVLRSALQFPDLIEVAAADPDWTLHVARGAPPECAGTDLGERRVREETYRLTRTPLGFRLAYSHAGVFDLSADASVIVWYPSVNASPELARTIVLGPVLALALEISGHLCLHGSAVAVGDTGIAFIAPKFHGKSTLASALARAGASFIGDDTLAVSPGDPPMLRPGTGSVRLWQDAAKELEIGLHCRTVVEGLKTTATGFVGSPVSAAAVALAAVYVLEPVLPDDAPWAAERVPLAAAPAVIALAHHAKLPDVLVGYAAAGTRLAGAAALARVVPVYTLRIARSFALLPAAVECILGWHSAPVAP